MSSLRRISKGCFEIIKPLKNTTAMELLAKSLLVYSVTSILVAVTCDARDAAETVVVKSGNEYEKAVTITPASLEKTYSNRTDRLVHYLPMQCPVL